MTPKKSIESRLQKIQNMINQKSNQMGIHLDLFDVLNLYKEQYPTFDHDLCTKMTLWNLSSFFEDPKLDFEISNYIMEQIDSRSLNQSIKFVA